MSVIQREVKAMAGEVQRGMEEIREGQEGNRRIIEETKMMLSENLDGQTPHLAPALDA